jgi:hypothetical protein
MQTAVLSTTINLTLFEVQPFHLSDDPQSKTII